MRDEMEARMWVEHHDQFSLSVDRALARLSAGLSRLRAGAARLASWDGTTGQLFAMALAFAVTALSFNTTA
jgi:X-X-X-Leu-X-X-Gly heptad repeat protein